MVFGEILSRLTRSLTVTKGFEHVSMSKSVRCDALLELMESKYSYRIEIREKDISRFRY